MADLSQPSKTISSLKSSVIVTRELHVDGLLHKNQPAPTNGGTLTGNVTLTGAEVLSGIYHADPGGAGRTVTLPTAALLVAAIGTDFKVGGSYDLYIINEADADEPIEIAAGAGGTTVGELTVEAGGIALEENSGSALLRIRITSATAYVVYRLG